MQSQSPIAGPRAVMSYYITRGTIASSRLMMLRAAPDALCLVVLSCCVWSAMQCLLSGQGPCQPRQRVVSRTPPHCSVIL
jgi:hypothetical protein